MFDVGGGEFLLIILVILLLFGPSKLPELARSVGKGLRTMRKAQEDLTQQIRDISADVTTPVTRISDQLQRTVTVATNPEAVPRTPLPPDSTPDSTANPTPLPSDTESETP